MPVKQEVFLEQCAPGTQVVVSKLRGRKEFTTRLGGMGISVGCQIEVLQNPARGPLLVRVRDTRIALGRGEASKILVRESECGQPEAAE